MERTGVVDRPSSPSVVPHTVAVAPVRTASRGTALIPQCGDKPCGCNGNGNGSGNGSAGAEVADVVQAGYSFVYALGRIEARFPSLGVEKEFNQVIGRTENAGLTTQEVLQATFAARQYRYIARQMCWVLTIEGVETYILQPRDPADFDLLIETLRPAPRPTDVDVVVGLRGPMAPPEMCNGLVIPVVIFSQIYSFDVDALIGSIPRPEQIAEDRFGAAAEELFWRIQQMADNAGATDEHRALNYLAVRYPSIYHASAEAFGRNASLTAVDVRPSRLSGVRRIVDVIFAFTDRGTDVTEKFFVRVDVTEEFPFLVSKLAPYFER
jgi:PatG C-terminal